MLDLMIKNGTIVDGTGHAPYAGDIGITGDRISVIGDLAGDQAHEVIDASGLIVAPGFVDIHTHSDFTLLVDPRAESQIHQGVTLELVGQCGHSLAPINGPEDLGGAIFGLHPSVEITWKTFDDYLGRLEKAKPGLNVGALVGHGPLRLMVMQGAPRPGTLDEIDRMARLLDEALEQGGFGFSTGLEYQPGKEARTDELAALCRVAAEHGGFYATHVRNRDIYYDLAFAEAISTARNSGVRLQISHINPKFGRPDSAMSHTLRMIDRARCDGVAVGFDLMTGNWNHTALGAFLPSWAFEGGLAGVLDLLTSPEGRRRLKYDPQPIWQAVPRGEWDRIRLFTSEVHPEYIGQTMTEIARNRGADPHDTVFDLLLEEGEGAARLLVVGDNFSEEDIELALTDPCCGIISDTAAIAPDGPYAGLKMAPLTYNWIPHFFQNFVRERKLLSLEEGVRRVTSLPAGTIGLSDRGVLRAGAKADVTIFNFETIRDNATIEDPNQFPTGIEHVVVNGRPTIQNGKRLPVAAGCVLRS